MAGGSTVIGKRVEHFGISSAVVADALRFDASFYNPRVAEALRSLRQSDMKIRSLGEVAERVFIPPRFKRIYVESEHGIPFLQGSHIIQFRPADLKYVSKTAHKKLDDWIVHAGWILVTRSGTVGRVAIAPEPWNGWAVSEHVLRIVPRDDPDCPPGYLASFLASEVGHAQLTAQIYGAVVDELTEEQTRSVQVPVARTSAQRRRVQEISNLAMRAVDQWTEAVDSTQQADAKMKALVSRRKVVERDDRVKINADPEEAMRAMLKKRRKLAAP